MKINVVIELTPEWEKHNQGLDIAEIIRECVENSLDCPPYFGVYDYATRGRVVSCEIVKEEPQ